VELASGQILASTVTSPRVSDATQVPELLDQISIELAAVTADGAYDSQRVYKAIETHQSNRPIRVIIPCRRSAVPRARHETSASQRDDAIRSIQELGRRRWEKASGYTRRSLVEAAISRYRRIIGGRLRSRTLPGQRTETQIACRVLNRMTRLGMPDGSCVV
jgi:hypothetical protein